MLDDPDVNKLIFPESEIPYSFNAPSFEEKENIDSSPYHLVKHFVFTPLQKDLAVKIFNVVHSRNNANEHKEYLDKVKKEFQLLRKLKDCPNIIKFYGIGLYSDQVWVCMELMDLSLHDFYHKVHKK